MRIPHDQFKQGNTYHLYNHAVFGSLLFKDNADYKICLKLIKEHHDCRSFAIMALCLMPNHYHILIKQLSETPPFEFMNKVWLRYAKYYNKRYARHGSIFAGKAQHKLVDYEVYMAQLIAYIHNNPVSAGIVQLPGDWPWSTFQEWAGKRTLIPYERYISEEYIEYLERHAELLESVKDDRQFCKLLF
ncbi:MAG: transposase [Candidatus Cloacimonetes bacterium]|nr:transposase [Candidatus Cloacimonadota bacterium]